MAVPPCKHAIPYEWYCSRQLEEKEGKPLSFLDVKFTWARKFYCAVSAFGQFVRQQVGLVGQGEGTLEVLSLESFPSLFEKALHSL